MCVGEKGVEGGVRVCCSAAVLHVRGAAKLFIQQSFFQQQSF